MKITTLLLSSIALANATLVCKDKLTGKLKDEVPKLNSEKCLAGGHEVYEAKHGDKVRNMR